MTSTSSHVSTVKSKGGMEPRPEATQSQEQIAASAQGDNNLESDFVAHVVDTIEPLPAAAENAFLRQHQHPASPGAYPTDPTGAMERARKVPFSLLAVAEGHGETDSSSATEAEEASESNTHRHIAGLMVASPVSESSDKVLPTAEEYDPEANKQTAAHATKREGHVSRSNNKACWVFGCLAAVLSISAIILTILLRDKYQHGNEFFAISPTLSPTNLPVADHLLNLLPSHTTSQLHHLDSPQARAYEWLMEDPLLASYSDGRLIQRFALSTLYYATNGHNWLKSSNWLSYDHHECDWFQQPSFALKDTYAKVYPGYLEAYDPQYPDQPCYDEELQNLWLDQNHLDGSLPLELYMLTSLQTLSVGLNKLQGTISTHIGQLTNLDGLAIFRVTCNGTIPSEVGLLTDLEVLLLQDNHHHGTIPTELDQLTNLDTYILNDNPELKGSIPSTIGKFSNLRWLHMEDCDLTGTIPTEVGKLSTLEWLILGDNELTGSLPTELGLLNNLLSISAFHNSLTGTLPSELGRLTTSVLISLRNNPSLEGSIPTEFGRLTSLKVLTFQHSNFSGTIPSELSNLAVIEDLSFLNNSFVGTIPSEFGFLTSLRRLSFGNNSLTGTVPAQLSALQSPNLYSLDLSGTNLSGTIPTDLCNIDGICSFNNINPCSSTTGLTFDCSSILCGCHCHCDT